jgi:hypothetical protein
VIQSALEFPAPHTVIDLAPREGAGPRDLPPAISYDAAHDVDRDGDRDRRSRLMVRGSKLDPGAAQNIFEFVYEFLSDFGIGSRADRPAVHPDLPRRVPAVLFDNWIGLVPPVGKIELLRAPSSDVNITIGMALVSFLIFEFLGFGSSAVFGYLGKFFPLYEFKKGIGAGIIALFVG